MPENIIRQVSNKFLAWAITGVGSLIALALAAILNFYIEWKADEAAEEIEHYQEQSLMFDSPEQKEEHKDHVKESPSALQQYKKSYSDSVFQQIVIKRLNNIDSTNYLNAVQNDVIKQELKTIKNNQ